MATEEVQGPKWMQDLEAKRERRLKSKLGHESGAGAPCLNCLDKCPGLDLHFWRKVCKNCKCVKESHDVQDDDPSGFAQFQLLGHRPVPSNKVRLPGKRDELDLDWIPKGTADAVEQFLRSLPTDKLPVKGSSAAHERKERLLKQIPLHDIDPTLCHDLNESELAQMSTYVQNVKENVVGQGEIRRVDPDDPVAAAAVKMQKLNFAENNPDLLGLKVLRPVVDVQNPTIPFITNRVPAMMNFAKKTLPTFNRFGQLVDNWNEPIYDSANRPIKNQFGPLHFDENGQLVNDKGVAILGSDSKPITKKTVFNATKPTTATSPSKGAQMKVINPVFELISRNYMAELADLNALRSQFSQPLFNHYGELIDGDRQVVLDEYNQHIGDQYGPLQFNDHGQLMAKAGGSPLLDANRRKLTRDGLYGKASASRTRKPQLGQIFDRFGKPVTFGKIAHDPDNNQYEQVYDRYGKPIHLQREGGAPLQVVKQPLYDATGRPMVDAFSQPVCKRQVPMLNADMMSPRRDESGDVMYKQMLPLIADNAPVLAPDNQVVYSERIPVASVQRDGGRPPVAVYHSRQPVLDTKGQLVTDRNKKVLYKTEAAIVGNDNVPVLDSADAPVYERSEPVLLQGTRPVHDHHNNRAVLRDFLPVLDDVGDPYRYPSGALVYQQNEPVLDPVTEQPLLDKQGKQLMREYVPVVDQAGRIVVDKFNMPLYEIIEPLINPQTAQPVFGVYPTPIICESKPVLNQFGMPLLDKHSVPIYERNHIVLDDTGKMITDPVSGDPVQNKTRVSRPYRDIRPASNDHNDDMYAQSGKLIVDSRVAPTRQPVVNPLSSRPVLDAHGQPIMESRQAMTDVNGTPIYDKDGNVLQRMRTPMLERNGKASLDATGQPLFKEVVPLVNSAGKPLYDSNSAVLCKEKRPICNKDGRAIKDRNGRDVCIVNEPFLTGSSKAIVDPATKQPFIAQAVPVIDDDDRVLLHNGDGTIYQFSEPFLGSDGQPYHDLHGRALNREYVPILDDSDRPLFDEDNGFPVYQQNEPVIDAVTDQPRLDADGNPVVKQFIPVVNQHGKVVVDVCGLPLYQIVEPVLDARGKPLCDGQRQPLCVESTPVIGADNAPIVDANTGRLAYLVRTPVVTDDSQEAVMMPMRTLFAPEQTRPANHMIQQLPPTSASAAAVAASSEKPEFYRQSGEKLFDDEQHGRQPNFIYEPFRDPQSGQTIRDANGKVVHSIRQPLVDFFGNHIVDKHGQKLYKDCIPTLDAVTGALVVNNKGGPVYKEIIPVLDSATGQPLYDQHGSLVYKENLPVFDNDGRVVLDADDNAVYRHNEPMLNQRGEVVSTRDEVPAYKYAVPLVHDGRAVLDRNGDPVYRYSEPVLDKHGAMLYDRNGKPVYRQHVPLLDERGHVVFDDATGKPVYQQNEPLLATAGPDHGYDARGNVLYKEYVPLIDPSSGRVVVDKLGDANLPLYRQNEPVVDARGAVAYRESVPVLDARCQPTVAGPNGEYVFVERTPLRDANGDFSRDASTGYPVYAEAKATKALPELYPANYFVEEDEQTEMPMPNLHINDIQYTGSTAALQVCHRCRKPLMPGTLMIKANRSGHAYHDTCFACYGCNHSLADMMYFYHKDDDEIYCLRDYAKVCGMPRCHGCDELIFTKQYCLTDNMTYHLKHFCCYNCDAVLAGEKYVLEEDHPYCFACFGRVKADMCGGCGRPIEAEQRGVTVGGGHYHADTCFVCTVCHTPLIGGKFKHDHGKLYCSLVCYQKQQ